MQPPSPTVESALDLGAPSAAPPPAVLTDRPRRRRQESEPSSRDSGWWRDAHLVRRVATGDSAALRELHDRHAPSLLPCLRAWVGLSGQAEEVLQETFLQAWRSADRYDPAVASPRSWLFMLARSRARDCLRSGGARARRERSFARSRADRTVDEPTGTANLEACERSVRVRRALRGLPSEQRLCLELAFWEELSHRQVAERLQQPLGTVKSRILLGLKKLRREMAA